MRSNPKNTNFYVACLLKLKHPAYIYSQYFENVCTTIVAVVVNKDNGIIQIVNRKSIV